MVEEIGMIMSEKKNGDGRGGEEDKRLGAMDDD